ncbi:MAG: ribosome-associated translation inhibitor RaiA [Bacteroidota bacterium]
MKITIQSLDFTSKQGLKDFVREKVNKLARFYSEIIGSEICLRLVNSNKNANKVCQIRLVIPGNDLLACAQCQTFEEAAIQAVEAIERQIKKLKTKMIRNRKMLLK